MNFDPGRFEIRDIGKEVYYIFDSLDNRMVLEIRRAFKREDRIQIYDVRTGEKVPVKSVLVRNFNATNLSEIVLNVLDEMLCQVCREAWGPVCDSCMEEAGDKTFLLFKQLQRMVE